MRLVFAAAAVVAVGCTLYGFSLVAGIACLVALGALVVRPALGALLRWSVVFVALSVVAEHYRSFAGRPRTMADYRATAAAGSMWQLSDFLQVVAVAVCLIAACLCLGVAVARLSPERRTSHAAVPLFVGALALGALTWQSVDAAWSSWEMHLR